jgi:DNA-binding transcriptional MerR regulator
MTEAEQMTAVAFGEHRGGAEVPLMRADVFTSGEVATFLETSLDEVDYWVRSKLLVPSIRQASGQGSRRLFNAHDVKQALLICRLRQAKWKPRQIARALSSLRSVLEDPSSLEKPLLIHEGNVFLILCRHQGNELVLLNAASPGQYVMVIALETLEEETHRRLARSK